MSERERMCLFQIQDMEKQVFTLRGQLSDQRVVRDREMEELAQSLTLQVENLQVNYRTS